MNWQDFLDQVRHPGKTVGVTVEGPLTLNSDRLPEGAIIQGVRFLDSLTVTGSEKKVLVFDACRFRLGLSFHPQNSQLQLLFLKCSVTGNCHVLKNSLAALVALQGCRVHGDVYCRETESGELSFAKTHITGRIYLSGGTLTSLDLTGATVDKGLFCGTDPDVTRIKGDLRLRDARMSGEIVLRGTEISRNLDFRGAKLGGISLQGITPDKTAQQSAQLDLNAAPASRLNVHGVADFHEAVVEGDLRLKNVSLGGLFLNGSTISGDVFIDADDQPPFGTNINGAAVIEQSTFGGQVKIFNTRFTTSLHLRDLSVAGDLSIGKKSSISGYLDMQDCCVKNLRLGSIWIGADENSNDNKRECGFFGRGLDIRGDFPISADDTSTPSCSGVFLLSDTKIGRNFDIRRLNVNGDLELRGVEIRGELNPFINWDSQLSVTGASRFLHMTVVLDAYFSHFRCTGDVEIRNMNVERDIFFTPSFFLPGNPIWSVAFQDSKAWRIRVNRNFCDRLNLAHSKCVDLEVRDELPQQLNLAGFEFRSLTIPRDDFAAFLNLCEPFDKRAWHAVEAWLRNAGREDEASTVFLRMRRTERQETRKKKRSFPRCLTYAPAVLWERGLDALLWLSIEPRRMFLVLLLLVSLSVAAFWPGKAFVPAEDKQPPPMTSAKNAANQPEQQPPPLWFSPGIWVGLRQSIPLLKISASSLEPSKNVIRPFGISICTYSDLANLFQALGWIVVSLFVASVTGVFKRVRPK